MGTLRIVGWSASLWLCGVLLAVVCSCGGSGRTADAPAAGDAERLFEQGESKVRNRYLGEARALLGKARRAFAGDEAAQLRVDEQLAHADAADWRYTEALERYRKLEQDRRRVLGETHYQTIVVASHIAGVERKLGKLDEDAGAQLRVVDELIQVNAPADVVARVRLRAAVALRVAWKLEEAEAQSDAAATLLGKEPSLLLAELYDERAWLALSREKSEEMKKWAEKAIAVDEQLSDPGFAAILHKNSLGAARKNLGDVAGAAQLFALFVRESEKRFGKDHPETAVALANLAQTKAASEGIPLLERAIAILEQRAPPRVVVRPLRALGYAYWTRQGSADDVRKAEALLTRAVELHPVVTLENLDAYIILTLIRLSENRVAEAVESARLAVRAAESVTPPHENLPGCYRLLGISLIESGSREEGIAALERSVEIATSIGHPELEAFRATLDQARAP